VQPRAVRVYSQKDKLASDNVLATTAGAKGSIWVGTARGVSIINDGQIRNIAPPEGHDGYRAAVLLVDKENALWMGWSRPSLARFKDGQWKIFPSPAEVGETDFTKALQEDREGGLWVSTGHGVACLKNGKWTYFSTSNGLSHNDVRVIHQ